MSTVIKLIFGDEGLNARSGSLFVVCAGFFVLYNVFAPWKLSLMLDGFFLCYGYLNGAIPILKKRWANRRPWYGAEYDG